MFLGALVGMRDRHQLDFSELVLADHAAGVTAGGTRLAAVTIGQRGDPDRQVFLVQDVAHDGGGQRHLGGRDQPAAIGGANMVSPNFGSLSVP